MAKYSNIAVIYGSDSSEWEVSCRSGEFVAARIDDTQYSIYEIFARFGKWQLVAFRKKDSMRITFPEGARPEVNKNDFSVNVYGEKVKLDYAYIVQHGKPGENGLLQGYFEMLGIPFSSCSAFVSTVVFDKYSCKSYLRDVDFVHLAPDVLVRRGMDIPAVAEKILDRLGLPVFVKPTDGGSSFGISKVEHAEDLPSAVRFAFTEGDTVIVEKGDASAKKMNREAVSHARASAQAQLIMAIKDDLTEEEQDVFRRGRNANPGTKARHSTMSEYRLATGFEALIGWLYLKGETERLLTLIHLGWERCGNET